MHIYVTDNVFNSAFYRISSTQLNNVQNVLHFGTFQQNVQKNIYKFKK